MLASASPSQESSPPIPVMSTSCKSKRGCGGRTISSSLRHSSESSTTTSSSSPNSINLQSLPSQYNFTPNAVAETQSNPHPPPPPNPIPPPPQNPTHPPPENQQAGRISLDQLLRAHGQNEFLPRISLKANDGICLIEIVTNSQELSPKSSKPISTHQYNWELVISPHVGHEFDLIGLRQMKGMVSKVRTENKCPPWISETLWTRMHAFWATEDAQKRCSNASNSQNSPLDGLGPNKNTHIQQDMVKKYLLYPIIHSYPTRYAGLRRPVSLREVFLRTQTRADGTYVDLKAKQIGEAYQKNLQERLSQIDLSLTSDGTSHIPELTSDQLNEIFRSLQFRISEDGRMDLVVFLSST